MGKGKEIVKACVGKGLRVCLCGKWIKDGVCVWERGTGKQILMQLCLQKAYRE